MFEIIYVYLAVREINKASNKSFIVSLEDYIRKQENDSLICNKLPFCDIIVYLSFNTTIEIIWKIRTKYTHGLFGFSTLTRLDDFKFTERDVSIPSTSISRIDSKRQNVVSQSWHTRAHPFDCLITHATYN